MKTKFDLTIVISSFNRDDKVLETLNRIFESDLGEFENVELLVIDDGSPRPVADVLPRLKDVPGNVTLRLVTQKNSGIGATRNRGFREAQAEIVVFMDDDILVTKDSLRMIAGAHRDQQGGVIFGTCPFVSHESKSLHFFAGKLFGYDEITEQINFEQVNAMASGLLSVNKSKLGEIESFYRDDLTIPAAEEHEIISRFHRLNIPIYHARHITAIHNHHLKLDWLIQQQYKYGLATAEAFKKYPEITDLEKFNDLRMSLTALDRKNVRSLIKRLSSTTIGRKTIYLASCAFEKLLPNGNHNFIYGWLTTSYFWAGYNEGRKKFR